MHDNLRNTINSAAETLARKLRALDYRSLPLSAYGKNYYAYDLRKLDYMLRSYAVMLYDSVILSGKELSEVSVLDHGGGIGIFSLLSKSSGVRTVICQDINPEISKDAATVAKALGINVDHFVSGDTKDFVRDVKEKGLKVDILGSRNVIEHVYDINIFLSEVRELPSEKLILYISTTANMKNPLVNRYTRKIHRNYEFNGKPEEWGKKGFVPGTSCFEIRKKLICEKFPSLNKTELDELATRTRGFMVNSIYTKVEAYLQTKKFPAPIADPTNTCDPFTGNWAEHLVPLDDYRKAALENGFTFDHKPGFYNTKYTQKALNLITPILNSFIRVFGKSGLFLAPFMSMILVRKSSN
ncbi:MAG TPA: hypothetical protein VI112_13805 [Bacteroidia bacterium]